MSDITKVCPWCGGSRLAGKTRFTAELGHGVLIVKDVSAKVCSQCGEEWIDHQTAARLQDMVDQARAKGSQVEVMSAR